MSSIVTPIQTATITKAARNSLAGVTVGSIVYQTDNNPGLRYFDGTNWNKFIPFNDP